MTINMIYTACLIFLARLVDVSVGTLRIVSIAKGRKYMAPILAFFEITVWLLAIREVMLNPTTPIYFIAYASGFALGNYLGLMIESRLAIGNVSVRIITNRDCERMLAALISKGYGLTSLDAEGTAEKVKIIYSIVKRKQLRDVLQTVKAHNPNAFYSIAEVHAISETGIFPREEQKGLLKRIGFDFLSMIRKAK